MTDISKFEKSSFLDQSMVTPLPAPLLKRSRSYPSSVFSVMSNCDELSVLSSSTHPPSKPIHVQQSLLILIHLHWLRRFINNHDGTNVRLTTLKTALPAFFGQVGYVSNHFLDSSFQAVKVFFQLHTFHADLEHLPKLTSLASFFGADLQSVFMYVYGISEIGKFLNYSGIITGLRIKLREFSDLEFLNNSSSLFPRLKQLEVEVARRNTSLSMLLIEALKTNTTVTSVDLEDSSIGAEGAKALAEALKVNASITSVSLAENSIGDEGVSALAEALKVNASITSICLLYNSIGAEGASALAEALKVNNSVTNIDLSFNSIGAEGARALAEALRVNASVTSIDLSFNSIGAEGARALAEALRVNASVTSINLGGNSIGAEGVKSLADVLKVNTSVSSIDLEDNCIGDEGVRSLADVLKVNASITSVNLEDNSIGDEGVRSLADVLKVNPRLKIVGVIGLITP
ncbi:hypothetical protein GEMRC1_005082 [Eukaryota sp. GEM-RC1]